MVDLVIISKINLKQKCSAVRKKEVGQLCSIYAATMLKMMKEAYIPDFEGWKKEVMERKTAVWSKEFNARWESFLKERDERVERKRRNSPYHSNRECDGKNGRGTDKRQGIWRERRCLHAGSQGKWDKCRNLANILSIMEDRNSKIKSFLKDGGGGLLRICWTTTPAKPPKYLNT